MRNSVKIFVFRAFTFKYNILLKIGRMYKIVTGTMLYFPTRIIFEGLLEKKEDLMI